MSNRAARLLLVVVSVVSMSIASAAPAAAVTIRWGWTVVRQASADYTPAAADQGNSSAGTNSVEHFGTGEYTVRFNGLGTTGGSVQVTVLGSVPRFCTLLGWRPVTSDLYVDVDCFDAAGVHADTRFTVDFLETNSGSVKMAYLWADQPAATGLYEPNPAYAYNSIGGAGSSIFRQSTGNYLVTLEALGSDRGSVQVTAYNTDATACRAVRWWEDTGSERVKVRCRDTAGVLVDSMFTLIFMQGTGLKAVYSSKSAYLWANHPTTASYQPDSHYRWSSEDTVATVTRSSVGVYVVEIPGMGIGGAALVTPTGKRKQRCIVSSIRTDAPPQRVGVRCFDIGGAPIDAAFSLAYVK